MPLRDLALQELGEVVNCKVADNYYLKTSVIYPGDMFLMTVWYIHQNLMSTER